MSSKKVIKLAAHCQLSGTARRGGVTQWLRKCVFWLLLSELHFLPLICAQQMGLVRDLLSSSHPALLCSVQAGVWEDAGVPPKPHLATGRTVQPCPCRPQLLILQSSTSARRPQAPLHSCDYLQGHPGLYLALTCLP